MESDRPEGLSDEAIHFWYGQPQRPTWQCEPPLKMLCETFDAEWPECTPAAGNRASWYAGLRKILREFGETVGVGFIGWAKLQITNRNRQRREQGKGPLTVVDAHSIYFLVPDYKKLKQGDGDRCPECNQASAFCRHEWGNRKRYEKYGGDW